MSPLVAARSVFQDARRALEIDELVLVVHDSMFPSVSGEDPARGSPYSRGALALYEFARDIGFTGVQFGPQGETSAVNRSPYDATVFARSVLSIAFERLADDPAWSAIVDPRAVEPLLRRAPPADGRVHYAHVYREQRDMVRLAFERFRERRPARLVEAFLEFRNRNAYWLRRDEDFEAHAAVHGTDDWRAWPDGAVARSADDAGALFAFGQWLVHEQHAALRRETSSAEWKLYGDLQVGISWRDRWRREPMFVEGYAMGAPPSRTDPLGQAWGFPVPIPHSEGVDAFLSARATKLFTEFDGLRVDHPHGLVTPWVYDAGAVDPLAAVAAGARLFDSPDVLTHPLLARFAIARSDQIHRSAVRYADGWVTALDEVQVDSYARHIAILRDAAALAGRRPEAIVLEVLSTQPYPLRRVMQRFNIGRFIVTQKASLIDRSDVYRSDNASPRDWIMFGNHDTAPMAIVLDRWRQSGELEGRAAYFAARLAAPDETEGLARALTTDRRALTRAAFADVLVSRARHVAVFASDLFGLREIYNRPGVVDDVNWTLRVPNDSRAAYRGGVSRGDAIDMAGSLALALRAKSPATRVRNDLIEALEAST